MTTNSRPRKFRLRKSGSLAQGEPAGGSVGIRVVKGAKTPEAMNAPTPPEADLAAIRQEGLTARQLRMARRLAQKHGIAATSEFDAVRLLRLKGIDPFERTNMLELVVPDAVQKAAAVPADEVQLLQKVEPKKLPSTETRPKAHPEPDRRAQMSQIQDIRRDTARRRRRKLALLAARLMFFVGLPGSVAGYYYYNVATPMYATETEFVIQQADGAGSPALGGLFSGTGFATSQDSMTVQSYLTSRDAMLRLDEDAGFKAHFSQPFIDPVQRLSGGATNEEAYDLYHDVVQIGYDPTEGIVKMEVIAADPDTSAQYSRLLIDYAEERVDQLTQRLREDQMAGARDSYEEAERKMLAAQNRVLELQERMGVLDPVAESGSAMTQITAFETQLREKRLELEQLLSNRRPNEARVAGVRGDIGRLQAMIDELRSGMTDGTGDVASLARISAEQRVAETELQTRTVLMQQALQQLETARIEANRQVRYLSLGVSPIAPDEPTYPRSFENTLLAFLIFSGIYLMMSLTASILREQVSS